MNRLVAGVTAVIGLLIFASVANAQVTLNLSVEARSVTYDLDSLGRRLTLNNFLFVSGGPCPATITLTDTLPPEVSFVSEKLGGGVFDPATRTITWSAVSTPCGEGAGDFSVAVNVGSSVPDGTTLTHTVRVTTGAAQTRTDDDISSLNFQVGFLPLPVSVDSSPSCRASSGGTVQTGTSGCGASGGFGAFADASGSLSLDGHEIGRSGGVLAIGEMGGEAFAGIDPDNARFASASFELNGNVHVTNPNPYDVALRFVRDDHLWATGSNGRALPPLRGNANADVDGLGASAGGFNAIQEIDRHLICDFASCRTRTETDTFEWPPPPPPPGVDVNPNADLVVPLEPEVQERTFSDCSRSAVVRAGQTAPSIEIDLSGSADGDTAALTRGFGMFSGSSSVSLSLCSVVPPPRAATLTISAHSPVDLLVTAPNGHQIGFDVAAGHVVNGIFGGEYSGRGSEPQIVTVPEPSPGMYEIRAQGRDTGPFTIDAQTLDADGNVLSTQLMTGIASAGSVQVFQASVGVAADTIPPTTTAIPSPSPNANGWNNRNVTVALTATDNPGGSGVKEIHFSLTGAQRGAGVVAGSSTTVTISAEETTTLAFFAVDNAGNQEAATTLTVRIDKTPPVIAGLPAAGCMLWPPDHRLAQVGTVTASDKLSGLVPGSLTVTGRSNEAVNRLGDGNTAPDIVISGTTVQLLAERSGEGTGRIYTLTASANDLAGNRATIIATCIVPHDQR